MELGKSAFPWGWGRASGQGRNPRWAARREGRNVYVSIKVGVETDGRLPASGTSSPCAPTAVLAMLALGNSTITAMIMDTVFSPLQESGVVTEQVFQHLIFLVALLIGFTLFRTSFQYLSIMTYEGCSQKLIFKLRRGFVQEHAGAGPGFLLQKPAPAT